MKYDEINDEIEDESDIGMMICYVLSYTKFSGILWNFFDTILGDDAYQGLKDAVKAWREEQEEELPDFNDLKMEKEPKTSKDDWL